MSVDVLHAQRTKEPPLLFPIASSSPCRKGIEKTRTLQGLGLSFQPHCQVQFAAAFVSTTLRHSRALVTKARLPIVSIDTAAALARGQHGESAARSARFCSRRRGGEEKEMESALKT